MAGPQKNDMKWRSRWFDLLAKNYILSVYSLRVSFPSWFYKEFKVTITKFYKYL